MIPSKHTSWASECTIKRVTFSRLHLAALLFVVLLGVVLLGCAPSIPSTQAHAATRFSQVARVAQDCLPNTNSDCTGQDPQASKCASASDNRVASFQLQGDYHWNDPRLLILRSLQVAAYVNLYASSACPGNYYVVIDKLGDYAPFVLAMTIHVTLYTRYPRDDMNKIYSQMTTDISAPYPDGNMYLRMLYKTKPSMYVCADITQSVNRLPGITGSVTDKPGNGNKSFFEWYSSDLYANFLCSQFSSSN